MVALSLVLLVLYMAWRVSSGNSPLPVKLASAAWPGDAAQAASPDENTQPAELPAAPLAQTNSGSQASSDVALPPFSSSQKVYSISRLSNLYTIIPTRPREDVISYTVEVGDSVFGIAKKFNIEPESVLWANFDQLQDSPDMLSPGMTLKIPPVNGVYYKWQAGDTFSGVASKFKADAKDIINWSGNHLDLTNPDVISGTMVLIPGGEREFVQWVVPTIPRGKAGVSRAVYGPGACDGGYDGAYGTGFFVWPIGNHHLSGNDYWSGHLGIDLAAGVGDGVFAADSGVVVFAGWSTGGYGYMVMIDHGNGYQTLYGHLSVVGSSCGSSVTQGQYIGGAGSTGNSTGPHLHFEVRYMGGFINPWQVLP